MVISQIILINDEVGKSDAGCIAFELTEQRKHTFWCDFVLTQIQSLKLTLICELLGDLFHVLVSQLAVTQAQLLKIRQAEKGQK